MSEEYPEIALERFDKANLWIKYIIFKINKFLKDDVLEVGAGCGSFTKGYMKNFNSKITKTSNIEVLTISNLMGEAIKRISNSTSVSDLFK